MRWKRRLRLRTPKTRVTYLDVECSGKFAMFGCWGVDCEEDSPQRLIAQDINSDPEIDFMVTAGDNFYKDFDLEKNLVRCYSKRMYATLGNHDVQTAEFQLAINERNWVMPARNYSLRIVTKNGTPRLRIVMLNTSPIYSKKEYKDMPGVLERELRELETFIDAIPESDLFTIVVGHHPLITNRHKEKGQIKKSLDDMERKIAGISNVYVCAEEHNLQHIVMDNLNEFIIGGGGAKPDTTILPDLPDNTRFKHPFHGYGIFDIKNLSMTLKPMNTDKKFDPEYVYEF
jgi:hypothetical protein